MKIFFKISRKTSQNAFQLIRQLLHLSSFTPLQFFCQALMTEKFLSRLPRSCVKFTVFKYQMDFYTPIESIVFSLLFCRKESRFLLRRLWKKWLTPPARIGDIRWILGGVGQLSVKHGDVSRIHSLQPTCLQRAINFPVCWPNKIFRGSSNWRKKLTTYPGHTQSRPSGSIGLSKHEMDGSDNFIPQHTDLALMQKPTEVYQ